MHTKLHTYIFLNNKQHKYNDIDSLYIYISWVLKTPNSEILLLPRKSRKGTIIKRDTPRSLPLSAILYVHVLAKCWFGGRLLYYSLHNLHVVHNILIYTCMLSFGVKHVGSLCFTNGEAELKVLTKGTYKGETQIWRESSATCI